MSRPRIDMPPRNMHHLNLEFCHCMVLSGGYFRCSGRDINKLCGLNVRRVLSDISLFFKRPVPTKECIG